MRNLRIKKIGFIFGWVEEKLRRWGLGVDKCGLRENTEVGKPKAGGPGVIGEPPSFMRRGSKSLS